MFLFVPTGWAFYILLTQFIMAIIVGVGIIGKNMDKDKSETTDKTRNQ